MGQNQAGDVCARCVGGLAPTKCWFLWPKPLKTRSFGVLSSSVLRVLRRKETDILLSCNGGREEITNIAPSADLFSPFFIRTMYICKNAVIFVMTRAWSVGRQLQKKKKKKNEKNQNSSKKKQETRKKTTLLRSPCHSPEAAAACHQVPRPLTGATIQLA